MIAWPSVAVGRREAGDVRISFFFGMRNHYSKYEITKGSCSPASCRGSESHHMYLTYSRNMLEAYIRSCR